MAASRSDIPSFCRSLANSTTRIAFLAARPISTTSPICVKILLSILHSHTPVMAANKHMGTIKIIAIGQGPTFVLETKHQENQQSAQREHQAGGVPGQNLLERQFGPFESHPLRQFFLGQFFHNGDGLARACARSRVAVDFGRGEHIVTIHRGRSACIPHVYNCLQGHHLPGGVADLEFADIRRPCPESGVGLHVHLPVAAEAGEIVDVGRA